jgi:hypothetical protein
VKRSRKAFSFPESSVASAEVVYERDCPPLQLTRWADELGDSNRVHSLLRSRTRLRTVTLARSILAPCDPVSLLRELLHQRNHQRNRVNSGDLVRRMRQERQERAAQRHQWDGRRRMRQPPNNCQGGGRGFESRRPLQRSRRTGRSKDVVAACLNFDVPQACGRGSSASEEARRDRSGHAAPSARDLVRVVGLGRTSEAYSARDCLAVRAREAVVRHVPRDAAGIIERYRGTLLAIDPATQAICCDISDDAAVVVEGH